ncbi:MAG: extracellular solute-binding protein family 1 [Paenibacillaceae bacterium]|jgi:multiple sugar transport system substrate-binding protein|nr:extracellular solute-binding protein family 1 [Paenibacillaceae bacterium]
MNWKKTALSVVSALLIAVSLASCSSSSHVASQKDADGANGGDPPKSAVSDPRSSISWKDNKMLLYNLSGVQDEKFKEIITNPLTKKFPDLVVDYVKNGKGTSLNELISAGQVPDVILNRAVSIPDLVETHIAEDLDPWVKKYNTDLNRFESGLVDYSKKYSDGKFVSMPYLRVPFVLYYNKDIFDKFGVPYPKDGMTWEQATQLAARVSRTDGGVEYHGIGINTVVISNNQLALTYVDPKTNKATINNASWAKLLNNFAALFAIPGNENGGTTYQPFVKDKTLAMLVWGSVTGVIQNDFNWDMVSLPVFPEAPKTGSENQLFLTVSAISKHKDAAYVLVDSLVSDEIQLQNTKDAFLTVLKDQKIKNEFGANSDLLKGKNTKAFSLLGLPNPPSVTEYDAVVTKIVLDKFTKELIPRKTDVNTLLREAEEDANKSISELQSQ